jgi:hypothetical protein
MEVPVNVFWDIENCAVPSGMKGVHVVHAIRQFALQRGILKNISAFANFKLLKEKLRADMQESGVVLHDIVTSKANSSDLAILVEILKVVIDHKPPHCIILISGDRDFANVISTLTFRKYKVVLIYSPQASGVLRNTATESVSWNELLKRGGKPFNPSEVPFVQPGPFTDRFQPLVKILSSFGGYQVKWTDLGNIVPYDKLGYPKLSHYLFAAEEAGLVKCGTTNNMPWVSMVNGTTPTQMPPLLSITKKLSVSPGLSPAYRSPSPVHILAPPAMSTASMNLATNNTGLSSLGNGIPLVPSFTSTSTYRPPNVDRNLVVTQLQAAIDSLKKDYFKPTETTLQKRIRELNLPLPISLDWEDIVDIAKTHYFSVEGEKPNRTIFPPQGSFEGADPNHPRDNYPYAWWKAVHQFLIDVHPTAQTGRYGFAVYLKEKGPPEVRDMPLGIITEVVQMALDRQLLVYNKKKSLVSTVGNLGVDQTQSTPQLPPPPTPPRTDADDTVDADDTHEAARSRLVGVTFMWPLRGTHTPPHTVLVTGSFFNWRNTIALHRREHDQSTSAHTLSQILSPRQDGSDQFTRMTNAQKPYPILGNMGGASEPEDVFSTVLYLPPGVYEYKFIVDGIWLHDPRQPVVTDQSGNINNIVDVKPLPAALREYV